MGLADAAVTRPGFGNLVPAIGMTVDERRLLAKNEWQLTDAHAFSTDPWPFRDYIRSSRDKFTCRQVAECAPEERLVQRAQRLLSRRWAPGNYSGHGPRQRAADAGELLFAFDTMGEILAGLDTINADYERHSRAARTIAEEYFRAEIVLAEVLQGLRF